MKKFVGVRFKSAGKIYDFECGAFVLALGDHVIVETENGLGFALVVNAPQEEDKERKIPLKKVFRLANKKDFEKKEKNELLENRAHEFCQEQVDKLGLAMNLFSVESTFDANKLTFFFTAEGRVDFRQLVKILVKEFKIRIEMRQVGIRNQAKMCGGLGRCGREICCSSFLTRFEPVSIRMAKSQGLSLNPTKISGQCGRLMCCLTYENKTYGGIIKKMPKIGKMVTLDGRKGRVRRCNVIREKLLISFDDGTEAEASLDKIKL